MIASGSVKRKTTIDSAEVQGKMSAMVGARYVLMNVALSIQTEGDDVDKKSIFKDNTADVSLNIVNDKSLDI